MKSSNKSSILIGTILIILAAIFSICLLLQPLDFGIGGPGHNNIFYYIGNMLITVYGFSSILIPVFLLIAGLSCFASIWTAQKTMRLITAIIPFFTCVFTEKICRSVLAGGATDSGIVKAVIAGVTGLMLVIIEIIGAGIIADRINQKLFYNGKTAPKYSEYGTEEADNNIVENNSDDETVIADEKDAESENQDDGNFKYEKIGVKKTIFDKALEKLSLSKKDEAFDDLMKSSDEVYGNSNGETIVENNFDAQVDEETAVDADEVTPEEEVVSADGVTPADEVISAEEESPDEDASEEEPKNPATIISQEEYAALLSEEDTQVQTPEADELEWNNLPPAPQELPPEYDEDFDENDPALEFPPKEEVEEPVFSEEPVESVENDTVEEPEFKDDNNNPYAAVRYIDSVVPNPAYPSGISIRNEEKDEKVQENQQIVKSKYPKTISFGRDEAETKAKIEPEQVESDIIQDYEVAPQDFSQPDEESEILSSDFFDIDMNNQPENEDLSDEIDDIPPEMEVSNQIFQQISNQENDINYKNISSSVFSQMDEDIRNDSEDFDETQLEPKSTDSPELNPNHGNANNLTADELTDFFNAQQEENTPKTKLIEGQAPKSHKATKKGPYVIPSNILTAYKDDQYWVIDEQTKEASVNLKQTLSEFNIDAEIIGIKKGPVVTMFEILPAPGVKLSKIVALQDNIALSLAAQSVRIVAPIPGKQAVGIEVPNKHRSVVGFREIIEMDLPEWNKMAVPVILGKDILGKAQLIDLVKTPHMLIAGATGSGKSVCVNSLILSILYKRSFKDVKLILVDPKVVELKLYNNIPHLLTPVITEPKKALQALQYCLCEMERRYALLDGLGVRDIASYNERIKERDICTEKLPYIVVIIDEFADLMATSGKELETIVARLTAMSRAVGIHLVLATQRPSVNVITGLIKANIPSRIAFMVASRTDSNIIIDSVGAEKLLGRGDMLYASAVDPAPIRIQGTYVNDNEVEEVVEYVKQYGEPDYIDDEIFVEDDDDEGGNLDLFGNNMDEDPLYDQALEIVVQAGKASASYIQRRLKIGYNRAARLVEEMEERGIVGPANGSKPREIIHIP